MTAMAVEKSPPDPPPPDEPSASPPGQVTPPSEGGSKDVRSTQDTEELMEYHEFSITVRKPRDMTDYYGMPLPHTLVNDVLNMPFGHAAPWFGDSGFRTSTASAVANPGTNTK